MSRTENVDVVVVGGGPAGSTIGALLAKAGHSVLILERERFPRYHIGESMVSGMAPLMEELGLIEELDVRFQHKSGISLRWGRDPEPWRSDFSAAFSSTGSHFTHAWHVRRGEFDELMLDNAQKLGAEARQEAQVTEILRDDAGAVTGVVYKHGGESHRVSSRFVVDASGQNRLLTRELTQTTWQEDLRNVAVWSYVDSYHPIEYKDDILVEAIQGGGWVWGIPLSETTLSVGYVLSAEKLSEATRGGRSHRDVFIECLEASHVAKTMIDPAAVGELRTARDWSHVSDTFHGPGWVAVGDAAAFIDPLFSSGVWLGTSGAWLAARAIGAALEDPEQEQRALERFDELYRQLFKDILGYVRFFMDPTRLREEYMERAQEIQKMVTSSSRVGFISMISGVGAIADVVNFDPMGVEDVEDVLQEWDEQTAASAAGGEGAAERPGAAGPEAAGPGAGRAEAVGA
ncbi:NAD(P)/FAD-dependent oxidoreductase [Streptomyces sp. TS71-3]|uniref:NAD(P)/FAD-dependent oxidoreductase n=1 Tax=Streptomyces sp. TS71-3 TaxID=2733862 RepID=UPI001B1AB037|nr:NAD(P)/FAD-dependent oxidoreductase [Streptomyces sp. TS71-3]GHJ36765.1 FAD-binding protein [Streptomyces sp. TS71-3]